MIKKTYNVMVVAKGKEPNNYKSRAAAEKFAHGFQSENADTHYCIITESIEQIGEPA